MKWLRLALDIHDPVGYFTYNGKEYPTFASFRGSFKPNDPDLGKRNRYSKIGKTADSVTARLRELISSAPESKEGKLSYAILLSMLYGLRIGSEDSIGYVSNLPGTVGEIVETFGVTTLRNEHVSIKEDRLILDFLGKKQVQQNIEIDDPLLLEVGKMYLNDPGDSWIGVTMPEMVRAVKQIFGPEFLVKDLRTYCANITCVDAMRPFLSKPKTIKTESKQEIKNIVETVAKKLGNTPAVSKSAYIDEYLINWFLRERTV